MRPHSDCHRGRQCSESVVFNLRYSWIHRELATATCWEMPYLSSQDASPAVGVPFDDRSVKSRPFRYRLKSVQVSLTGRNRNQTQEVVFSKRLD